VTNTVDLVYGTSERTDNAVTTRSIINYHFTIASATTYEIRHRCSTSRSTDGFGIRNNFSSTNEIFTIVEIQKIG
jgi:hypothetical protein